MAPETQIKKGPRPLYVVGSRGCSVWCERMLRDIALGDDMGGCRLAVDCARDRLFRGLIVEVLNLLIVLGVPMDEHADANEQIVGFADGNNARGDTVGDSLGDAMLSRTEHL